MIFDVDEETVDKDCKWLEADEAFNGEELCEYMHIAYKCPQTCEDCSILEES
jgi:hypothetical protein